MRTGLEFVPLIRRWAHAQPLSTLVLPQKGRTACRVYSSTTCQWSPVSVSPQYS